MNLEKILIVSGTHGNEINPIWAVEKFKKLKKLNNKDRNTEKLKYILGNPEAVEKGLRYLDCDLNRSFNQKKTNFNKDFYELKRAEYLLERYGIDKSESCQIIIDLHTTTASMGTSVVMYGRREKDFCLAAILQHKFGLPIYLHEKDKDQTGFFVEAWPCGLVIEIGSVAQNHYDSKIVENFITILEFFDNLNHELESSRIKLPQEINVFVHQYSIDYPRDVNSNINALIHPQRIGKDWSELKNGDPLFLDMNDKTLCYEGMENMFPVFIGEAAYREKNIAMSFTKKENIQCSNQWLDNFLTF